MSNNNTPANSSNPALEGEVVQHGTVTIAQLGGDETKVEFQEGLTIGMYLKMLGIVMAHGQVVSMNGEMVNIDDQVEPNSVINLVSRITNG